MGYLEQPATGVTVYENKAYSDVFDASGNVIMTGLNPGDKVRIPNWQQTGTIPGTGFAVRISDNEYSPTLVDPEQPLVYDYYSGVPNNGPVRHLELTAVAPDRFAEEVIDLNTPSLQLFWTPDSSRLLYQPGQEPDINCTTGVILGGRDYLTQTSFTGPQLDLQIRKFLAADGKYGLMPCGSNAESSTFDSTYDPNDNGTYVDCFIADDQDGRHCGKLRGSVVGHEVALSSVMSSYTRFDASADKVRFAMGQYKVYYRDNTENISMGGCASSSYFDGQVSGMIGGECNSYNVEGGIYSSDLFSGLIQYGPGDLNNVTTTRGCDNPLYGAWENANFTALGVSRTEGQFGRQQLPTPTMNGTNWSLNAGTFSNGVALFDSGADFLAEATPTAVVAGETYLVRWGRTGANETRTITPTIGGESVIGQAGGEGTYESIITASTTGGVRLDIDAGGTGSDCGVKFITVFRLLIPA